MITSTTLKCPVTPDLIRGEALLCCFSPEGGVAKGSWAPDQVRGDDQRC